MMETTIRTFNGTPYTMQLTRDVENHVYKLGFYAQSCFNRVDQEVHTFPDFETAWEHFSNNMHYYCNIRPVPITEEQFLNLPATYLYGNSVRFKNK